MFTYIQYNKVDFNKKSWLNYLYSKDAMMAISIYIITNRL